MLQEMLLKIQALVITRNIWAQQVVETNGWARLKSFQSSSPRLVLGSNPPRVPNLSLQHRVDVLLLLAHLQHYLVVVHRHLLRLYSRPCRERHFSLENPVSFQFGNLFR